jgi:zinc transport system ATP-binding protein
MDGDGDTTVTDEPLLSAQALEVGYRNKPILPPVDVTIGRGEFWVVVGRNGSGKTTLFRTLLGLLPPVAGRVERAKGRLRLSYLPQHNAFDSQQPLRARDMVAQGCDRAWSFLRPRWSVPAIVDECFDELGITSLANQPFHALSEGQKQRVLLARLAVSRPDVGFLDEPTAAMDVEAEQESFAFLDSYRRRHQAAVVVVSHYLGLAQEYADYVMVIDAKGQKVTVRTPPEVSQGALTLPEQDTAKLSGHGDKHVE